MPSLAPPSNRTDDLSATPFSPEFRLLLACCRHDTSQSDVFASPLGASVDWKQLFTLMDFHGVLPPVHGALSGALSSETAVPADVRTELGARFDQNARKNLRLAAELIRVLDCLETVDIPAVPYKGPALAESLYGDIALREFSDLDVLVRSCDLPRAKAALAQIGFVPNLELTDAQERAYLATGYEYTLDGPAGKNLLEIQWNFVPRFFAVDFAMEPILARCVSGSVAGRTVRILRDEDLLLSLCVHAAKHLWKRLCWLRDVASLLERSTTDFERVARDAQQLGIARILEVNVLLAQRLLGVTAPAPLQSPGEAHAESLTICAEVERSIPDAEVQNTESLAYIREMLRLRERATDRMRFLTRLALTPSIGEWQLVNLPGAFFPLYRVVRIARLAGRAVGM
jgi:hypothetical protein